MTLPEYRRSRIAKAAADAECDLIIASLPANINYTSGYRSIGQDLLHRTQAYTVFVPETSCVIFVVSVAEIPSVVEVAGMDAEIFCFGGFQFAGTAGDALTSLVTQHMTHAYCSPEEALAAAIAATGKTSVALDESRISRESWNRVALACPNCSFKPGSAIWMTARMIKHPEEISGLERSALIADSSLKAVLTEFKPGMTELDLELMYKIEVTKQGGTPFFFVGTAAKRAAYSDTKNTSLRINGGDMIRFDYGCIYEGYYSDLARTAFVGSPPSRKVKTYYEAVRTGTSDAIAAIRPGVTAGEIFNIAEDSTKKAGISHYKRHHCGHGIGVEVYDLPSISPGNASRLEKDMVLCIETPYYELGWGGVQVENTIVITADGCRYLDKSGDRLIVLEA